MQLRRCSAAALYLLFLLPFTTDGHNITTILSKLPEFSKFNNYLTLTQLAEEINRRQTITVCAVDDAGMNNLLVKSPPIATVKNALSLHVLLDYFDGKKLRNLNNASALAATVFQASGAAPGTSGIVNITDLRDGSITFAPKDNGAVSASFIKSIQEIPYNLSVIQISTTLPAPATLAPPTTTPPSRPPAPPTIPLPSKWNFTGFMSDHGCKAFAETLLANPAAQNSYAGAVTKGLTIFCPGDDAMKKHVADYNNLTADEMASLLRYHAAPVYQSADALRSFNGSMSTLATSRGGGYGFVVKGDGYGVEIDTGIVSAKVADVVKDEQPLAIYAMDKVLLPREMFKTTNDTSPGPAATPSPEIPAEPPQEDGADDDAKNGNGAVKFNGEKFNAAIFVFWFVILLI